MPTKSTPNHTTPRSRIPTRFILGSMVGGMLVAAGAVAMVKPSGEAPVSRMLVSDVMGVSLRDTTPIVSTEAEVDTFFTETRIESGDTIAAVLNRLGVSEDGLIHFINVNKDARAGHRLVPGRTVQAAHDGHGGLRWVRYYHTPGTENKGEHLTQYLEISKIAEKNFEAKEVSKQTESSTHVGFGVIESSLFAATDAAGIPDGVTIQMAEILSDKIDFMRDMRKGDQFRVIYETRYHEGRPAGTGRVLAVEFINKGRKSEAYWYAEGDQSGGYYDASGKNLRGAFLRNPIKFTRVSSTFGMRKHPIHNKWRSHNGVDLAAPSGTPIRASADGVVEAISSMRGYGNTIILRHPNNITTLYAHQSRFAKGLKKGDRVSQGDVIGFVGSTGWATGPHLHYEFRVNGKPIDPHGIKLPEVIALEEQQIKAFTAAIEPLRTQIERLATLQKDNPDILKVAFR